MKKAKSKLNQSGYSAEHIPLLNKIGYAFGAMADNLMMNAFSMLVMPVYNIALYVDPVLLGWAIAIPRIFDAITDPVMGNISDNTRSRWGRRRPYIFVGAVLCALLLPVIWMSPFRSDWGVFWWLTVLGTIYFLAYTVYIIPYQALGYEMTTDYDERTRLLAWPNYVGLTMSFVLPWLPRMIEFKVFGGAAQGAIWICTGVGFIIFVSGLMPVLFGREIAEAKKQERISLWVAVKESVANRSFLIVALSNVIVLTGLATLGGVGLYVNIFYIFDGDRAAGMALAGLGGTIYAIVSYFSVMLAVWLATRLGKKSAAQILLAITLAGSTSLWLTLRPDYPYLQLLSTVLIGLGLQGTWMTFFTMVGDVCEEDELKSGLRREGIFSSIGGFSRKMAVAAAAVFAGNLLKWIGFDAEAAVEAGVPGAVLSSLKLAFVLGQVFVVGSGLVLISFYPITRKRALETQRLLKERRGDLTEV